MDSFLSLTTVGRKAGLKVIRAGELALPFTCCSTWENKACILPGQNNRTDPGCGGLAGVLEPEGMSMEELALPLDCYVVTLEARERFHLFLFALTRWESWPCHLSIVWERERCLPQHLPLTIYSRSWSWT